MVLWVGNNSHPLRVFSIPGCTKTHQSCHLGYEPWALFILGNSFRVLRATNKLAQAMSTMVYSFPNVETVPLGGQGEEGEGAEGEESTFSQ